MESQVTAAGFALVFVVILGLIPESRQELFEQCQNATTDCDEGQKCADVIQLPIRLKLCMFTRGTSCRDSLGCGGNTSCFDTKVLGLQCGACQGDTDCTADSNDKFCIKAVSTDPFGYCGSCRSDADCPDKATTFCDLAPTAQQSVGSQLGLTKFYTMRCVPKVRNSEECERTEQCLFTPCDNVTLTCGGEEVESRLEDGEVCRQHDQCRSNVCHKSPALTGGNNLVKVCGLLSPGEKCRIGPQCDQGLCVAGLCKGNVTGLKQDGEPCGNAMECQSKMCRVVPGISVRVCGLKSRGEVCSSNSECLGDAVCVGSGFTRVCSPPRPVGGSCHRRSDCQTPLFCQQGQCAVDTSTSSTQTTATATTTTTTTTPTTTTVQPVAATT